LTERKSNKNNDNLDDVEEEENKSGDGEKDEKLMNKQQNENTKNCIDTLLKIINIGLDKSYDDFSQDISMQSQALVKISETFNMMTNTTIKNTPITSFRKYIKPKYHDKFKLFLPIYDNNDIIVPDNTGFNLYETFKHSFKTIYDLYFDHLKDNEEDKDELIQENKKKRYNLFNDYRMKFALIEEKKIMTSFINQIYNLHRRLDNDNEIEINEEKNNFWIQFINPKDFDVNFILYLLPRVDNYKDLVPQVSKEVKYNATPLLSEFLANHDYIYQTLVFTPWALQKEADIPSYLERLAEFTQYKSGFSHP
jgi:hypothetical protein